MYSTIVDTRLDGIIYRLGAPLNLSNMHMIVVHRDICAPRKFFCL